MNIDAPQPRVALIAGPTASGKSALALQVAERAGGVIVNADASQVYADLSIVSARPSAVEVARVPHHLFGHVDGADTGYSAARWAAEAAAAIARAHAVGRLPVVVGGTGLYLRTLLEGIAPIPPIDPAIRAAVRALPVAEAYAALARTDPDLAAILAPADTTRVARALEVVRATGRSIASWRRDRVGGIGDRVDLRAVVALPDRAWLDARIAARFAAMLDQGGIAEVAALLARTDVPADAPVRRAIGVAEIAALLRGEADRAETIHRGTLATRRYAKRQSTWFRNQPPTSWHRLANFESCDLNEVVDILLR